MFDTELRSQTDIESELHRIDEFNNNKKNLYSTRDAHYKYKRSPPSRNAKLEDA